MKKIHGIQTSHRDLFLSKCNSLRDVSILGTHVFTRATRSKWIGLDWESKCSLRWTFLMTAMNVDSRGSRVLLNQLGTWFHFQQDGCSWIFLFYNRSARGRNILLEREKFLGPIVTRAVGVAGRPYSDSLWRGSRLWTGFTKAA